MQQAHHHAPYCKENLISEDNPQQAQAVADRICFDAQKRDILKTDAPFFEPINPEAVRKKIDADYEAVLQLRRTIAEGLE